MVGHLYKLSVKSRVISCLLHQKCSVPISADLLHYIGLTERWAARVERLIVNQMQAFSHGTLKVEVMKSRVEHKEAKYGKQLQGVAWKDNAFYWELY